jgi:hypothetical protein
MRKRNPIDDLLNPLDQSVKCGAKARSTGEPCKKWASIGYRRCKFHGGASGSGRPKIHGRRSAKYQRDNLAMRVLMHMIKLNEQPCAPIEPEQSALV